MKRFGNGFDGVLMLSMVLLILLQHFALGSSLFCEGRLLSKFQETIEVDPLEYTSNWTEEDDVGDPCSLAGIACEDGRVVNLNHEDAIGRKLLATHKGSNFENHTLEQSFQKNDNLTQKPPSESSEAYSPATPFPHSLPPPSEPPQQPLVPIIPPPTSIPFQPPPASPGKSKKDNTNALIFPLIGVGAGVLVLAVLFIYLCKKRKVSHVKPLTSNPGLSGQLRQAFVKGVPALKHSELKAACEDFSNEVGSLSDGILYKGSLSSGVEIAASVFKDDNKDVNNDSKSWTKNCQDLFRTKIKTLSKVNHKNFVNLIGYCEEDKPLSRIMVFEYASNGTLFEHLHPKEGEGEHLSWVERIRIAMGVAYCLSHMHQLNPPFILHNINSTSIHLTDDFAAKVADLELRSGTTSGKSDSENSGLLSHPVPDQASIVHKFGVILLELISGRVPYSEENGGLVNWSSDYLKGLKPLEEMLDPTLTSFRIDTVRPLLSVIISCLNPVPSKRPSMKDVAGQLSEITGVTPESAAPRLSPLWWAELEIVSSVAVQEMA